MAISQATPDTIRTLSLWQPWASALFLHNALGDPLKPDETRHWPTNVHGRIAIHAAQRKTYVGVDYGRDLLVDLAEAMSRAGLKERPLGAIIGTIELGFVQHAEIVAQTRTGQQRLWGDYRKFGDNGKQRFAFAMFRPQMFREPVPWRGKQGWFNVPLSALPEVLV